MKTWYAELERCAASTLAQAYEAEAERSWERAFERGEVA